MGHRRITDIQVTSRFIGNNLHDRPQPGRRPSDTSSPRFGLPLGTLIDPQGNATADSLCCAVSKLPNRISPGRPLGAHENDCKEPFSTSMEKSQKPNPDVPSGVKKPESAKTRSDAGSDVRNTGARISRGDLGEDSWPVSSSVPKPINEASNGPCGPFQVFTKSTKPKQRLKSAMVLCGNCKKCKQPMKPMCHFPFALLASAFSRLLAFSSCPATICSLCQGPPFFAECAPLHFSAMVVAIA